MHVSLYLVAILFVVLKSLYLFSRSIVVFLFSSVFIFQRLYLCHLCALLINTKNYWK